MAFRNFNLPNINTAFELTSEMQEGKNNHRYVGVVKNTQGLNARLNEIRSRDKFFNSEVKEAAENINNFLEMIGISVEDSIYRGGITNNLKKILKVVQIDIYKIQPFAFCLKNKQIL
jgi:hypothetical protein